MSGKLVSAEVLKLKSTTSSERQDHQRQHRRHERQPRRCGGERDVHRRRRQREHQAEETTTSSEQVSSVKDMALPIGQLKPKENCVSMKCPIIAAPPPTKRGVT